MTWSSQEMTSYWDMVEPFVEFDRIKYGASKRENTDKHKFELSLGYKSLDI